MNDLRELLSTQAPWMISTSENITATLEQIKALRSQKNMGCFVMQGSRMRNWDDLFNEFSKSLNFPSYFGKNLSAFDDCMTDLAWFDFDGYVIIISESEFLLKDCPADDLCAFLSHLQIIASYWNEAIAEGQPWDRDGKPFHWIFHPPMPI